MCAWPRAASGTCSQQPGKPHPTGIRWGRVTVVSTQRPTPSYMVGSSGKIRVVVVWKEKCAPELVPELCPTAGDVDRAGPI